jgi:hypothetical protein
VPPPFRGIAESWAEQDLVKAATWLQGLPAGGARDGAVTAFSRKVIHTDPEGAAVWASTIADAEVRTSEVERAVRLWMRTDRNAAQQWMASTNALPAQTRDRLLQQKE